MKSMLAFFVTGTLVVSSMAQARYIGPILVKETRTGFTVPEFSKSEKCEIYADRVVLTTIFGGTGNLQSVKTTPHTLTGDIQGLLKKASQGTQAKLSGSVDGNSVRHFGNIINPNDTVRYVGFYYENGATGELIINQSSEARSLKFVIENLCPNMLQGSDGAN